VVASIEWPTAADRVSGRRDEAFYEGVVAETQDATAAGPRDPRLADDLLECPPEARAERLTEGVRVLASKVLGIAPGSLPLDRPLGNSGLDSLMAMELRNRLERALDLRLPATIVWSYPTVAALAEHLLDRIPFGTPSGEDPDDSVAAVDAGTRAASADLADGLLADGSDSSEEEILRMLREGS